MAIYKDETEKLNFKLRDTNPYRIIFYVYYLLCVYYLLLYVIQYNQNIIFSEIINEMNKLQSKNNLKTKFK